MAVCATIGVEKAIRLLQERGIRFTAQAVGTKPPQREIDEAAAEISAALNQHPQTTAAKVATARGIARRLPTTLARLAAGELSLHQATRVEHALRDLEVTTAQAVEADAVPGNPRRLWHRLETALARHAPDHVKNRDEKRRAHREAYYWSDPADGTAGIGIQGPLELLAQIKAAIDSTARPRAADDARPIGTRRFDVLLDWARESLGLTPKQPRQGCTTCGRTDKHIPINVTVGLETLLRLSDTAGDLNGVPIPAEVARSLAADGRWRRLVTAPTGELLDVGADTYVPNKALARFIRARDRTCRMPGCNRPAADCDLDHTISFSIGGKTITVNLAALCRRHHRLKHETAWNYTRLPDGTFRWTAPSGRTYDREPEDFGDDPILSGLLAQATARARDRQAKRDKPEPKSGTRRTAEWNNPLEDADDTDLPF